MSESLARRPHLRSTQSWFLHLITRPDLPDEVACDEESRTWLAQVESSVKPGRTETSLQRLAIYQQSYFSRLVECLADDYPALRFALGEQVFSELCRAYAIEYPSKEPSLNFFGRHLSGFVRQRLGQSGAFATELAHLEWALVEAGHTPSGDAFDAADLRALPPEQLPLLRFIASPSLRLFGFEYPVNDYLQGFFDDQSPEAPAPQSSFIAVVRQQYSLWRFGLGATQAALLERLIASEPLGAALDGIDATPEQLQKWFGDWTQHGMFSGVIVGDR